ncbi:proliferating cell nuclear antigen-like [Hydractinia symbiolongicarpus]|uniref:proliferating cell nuclear antigen-like n=1 Tax=Hydractinia symbiolongicarpus TaxID=13093 RepID=UPI0025504B4F|nr:proliferating cell nuclear antigen-like [Hydractinia symbiolongicarpus]
MFEAKLEDGTPLKKLIESMKDLFTDVNFDCTAAGISCQAMDSSHVCLCSVLLKADSFDPYRCDRNLTLGMNCVTLSKILKCAGNDESITVRAEDNADTVSFVYEKPNQERVSKFEMKVMDIDSEHLGIPDQEYDAIIRLPSHEFSRICRDLSQFGDTVTIAATKDGIRFSCSGETGNGSITLRQSSSVDSKEDEEVSIELNEAVTQTYAMRFLILFSKAQSLSKSVALSICQDVPLVVEYKIGDCGHIRYFLAPKIDDDIRDDMEQGGDNDEGQQNEN